MSRLMTKPTMWLCAQRSLRSALASAQSDESLRLYCLTCHTLKIKKLSLLLLFIMKRYAPNIRLPLLKDNLERTKFVQQLIYPSSPVS